MGAGIEESQCSPSTSSPSPSAASSPSSASGRRSPSGCSTRKPQLSDTDSAHSVICSAECSIEDNEKMKDAGTPPPPLQSRQTAAAVAVLAGFSAVYLTYSQRHPLLFYLMTILIVIIVTSLYSFGFCAVLYMVRRDYYEEEEEKREESDYGEEARRRIEERGVVDGPAPSPSTTANTCLTGMPEASCLRIPIDAHALESAEAVQRL